MIEVKTQESFVRDERNFRTDLIPFLHFFGNKYMEKIAIFSSGTVTCHIVNAMPGTKTTDVNEKIKDGMGEIVNMKVESLKEKIKKR